MPAGTVYVHKRDIPRSMIRNYLIIAFRQLSRQRVFVLINLLGLALGMAISMLIVLFIRNEKIYDHFHVNAERIFRVAEKTTLNGRQMGSLLMPYEMAPWLLKNSNEVE